MTDPKEKEAAPHRTAARLGLHEVAGDAAPPLGGFGSPPPAEAAPAHRQFGHEASPEQRLTALANLLDKGLLTESEYETKRAEIISGL